MIKAFISHSSKQKPYVHELVEILGRNYCIVDCFDFEPAYRSLDEIYAKIDKCTVFVLLLSKDSVNSEWVNKEIARARSKMEPEQYKRFWPYIIDENLQLSDCPEWIRKDECFNLKFFRSSRMLANDIDQKFRRIFWKEDGVRKQIETVMIGRNSDIDKFESLYQSQRGMHLRSLIVSGRDGVGKDMFISQCMSQMSYELEAKPYLISLNNKEGVENFIIQLNLITRTYTHVQLEEILKKDIDKKSEIAVSLLNEIYDANSLITIEDNSACVVRTRKLAEWLVNIIESPKLHNKLGLFVKSHLIPNAFIETEHPNFGHISLKPLETKDRKKLFYKLLRVYGITEFSENDVDFFVQKLLWSPSQIVKAVETLYRLPISQVKRDINILINWGDEHIKPLLQIFFNNEDSKNLLIVLSKFDFISSEILNNIYEEEIGEILTLLRDMIDYGIVSVFGPDERFFRLDHYVCEYINRCHLKLPMDLNCRFNEVLEEKIENCSDITEDASVYLYEKKQNIISGKATKSDFLIPSVVATSAMEVYNEQNYPLVIKICDMVLTDCHNYSHEQEREMRYWLCLALARTVNTRFFEEVKYIKDVDYYFLQGFYYRNSQNYNKAESFLRKTLQKSPHMQRAKRELVTVLLAQDKYEEALNIAKETYEKNPENSYQIQSYFRCLVRQEPLTEEDKDVLLKLLNAMKENLSDKRDELFASMNIEYKWFVEKLNKKDMLDLIQDAEIEYPNSQTVSRVSSLYKKYHNIQG